jgi:hypothetical protein
MYIASEKVKKLSPQEVRHRKEWQTHQSQPLVIKVPVAKVCVH